MCKKETLTLRNGQTINLTKVFQSAVGGPTQNVQTVKELIEKNTGSTPTTSEVLEAIDRAGEIYDIQWRHVGEDGVPKYGYNFVRKFSGPPITFQNSFPGSHAQERIDPDEADTFQKDNPDWTIVETE